MTDNYVLVLHHARDKAQMLQELSALVLDPQPGSRRLINLNITEEQARQISADSRVRSLTLDPTVDPHVGVDLCPIQRTDFNRNSDYFNNASWANWGLARSSVRANPYGGVFNTYNLNTEYRWNIDTSEVDIIIVDSGVQADHPEFAVNDNGSGGSRVVDYDWHALAQRARISNIPTGSSIGGYLGDSNGHGTHVAGTAAGNRQGWARKARIYTMRVFSGPDIATGTTLGAIPIDKSAQLARAFHEEKKAQGITRPTICNNSWAYFSELRVVSPVQLISQVVWRGTIYDPDFYFNGELSRTLYPQTGVVYTQVPLRFDPVDSDIEDAINEGVIYTAAANNFYYKIDVPGGDDYDNHIITTAGRPLYYHRGSTPGASPGVICVGNLDNSVNDGSNPFINREVKNQSSSCGPRIDIWAPGTAIFSAYKYVLRSVNVPGRNSQRDPRCPPDRDYWLWKISGTSMACPQVSGVLAQALALNPDWNQDQCRAWLTENATLNALTEESQGYYRNLRIDGLPHYTNHGLLQGAPNYLLYNPYGQAWAAEISGSARISGSGRLG